jgi:hypothetical protein
LLDFVGAKMLELEDVDANRLEAEGHILPEVVAEHVPPQPRPPGFPRANGAGTY